MRKSTDLAVDPMELSSKSEKEVIIAHCGTFYFYQMGSSLQIPQILIREHGL
jgi:hypothetical protein